MNQPFLVRKATEGDAAALNALRLALFEETDTLLWEPGEYRLTVADEAKQIAQLHSQRNSICLVAERGGELVGFLNAMGMQVNRRRQQTRIALAVRREHWGIGCASKLISEALAWSREAGLVRVELTVHTSNVRAISVYLRAGFQVEGIARKALIVSGRYVDEYQMAYLNEA
jgi:RimJ/RimL family protein N-acetyltransferase